MRKTSLFILIMFISFKQLNAQKGEQSLAAGLVAAFPGKDNYNFDYDWNTGFGVEVSGQSNLTQKGAVLLQLQALRFTGKFNANSTTSTKTLVNVSLQGGYRYQFAPSGFFANVLVGAEAGTDGSFAIATVGAGKRFSLGLVHFMDASLEYTGSFLSRFNVKAVVSLFQRDKE